MNRRWKPGIIASGTVLCLAFLSGGERPRAGQELDNLFAAVRKETGHETVAYQQLSSRLETISDPDLRAQAAFALALSDRRRGQFESSLRWMEKAREGSLLNGTAAYYSALIAFEAGQPKVAVDFIRGREWRAGHLRERVQGLRATLLIADGQPDEAAALLAAESKRAPSTYLLFHRAQALKAAGKTEEAVAALRTIFFEFPLSEEASEANHVLVEWKADPDVALPKQSAGQWRRRAEVLWGAASYPGAEHAYTELAALVTGTEKSIARLRAATALYRQGKRTSACRSVAGVGPLDFGHESERRALLARCDLRSRRWDRAAAHIAALSALAATADRAESGDDIDIEIHRANYASTLLAAGQTAYLRGEHDLVRRYYRRYLNEFPDGGGAAASEWKLAWLEYQDGDRAGDVDANRDGKHAAAAKLMQSLLQRGKRSRYFSRALYWRGRIALQHDRDQALAQHLFSRLIELSPRDFLASYAREELGRLRGSPAGDYVIPDWVDGLSNSAEQSSVSGQLPPAARNLLLRVDALIRVGLADHADEELAAELNPDAAKQSEPSELSELWLARADVAAERGDLPLSVEYARTAYPAYLHAQLDQIPARAWKLLFPLEYWDAIQSEAARREVDPYLVAGLIRQESRFDREAVSSAGALGLMQLMPATARGLARNRGLSRDRILTPELNIRLGVQHLAGLFRRFKGAHDKAIAAYNGGGTRVARWLRELPADDPPAFVESIPYTQTREFVYIVSRNHNFYRDLYAGAH